MGDPIEKTLIFGNLKWSLSENDVKEEILKYGQFDITKIQIPRSSNGFSKGLAIVEFSSVDQANEAKSKINEQKIADRICYVSLSKDSPASNKEGRSERRRRSDRRDRERRYDDRRRERSRRRYDDYSDYDDDYYRRRRPRRSSRYYDYDYSDDDRDYRRRSRRRHDRRDSPPPRRRRDYSPSPRSYSPSPRRDSGSDSDRGRR